MASVFQDPALELALTDSSDGHSPPATPPDTPSVSMPKTKVSPAFTVPRLPDDEDGQNPVTEVAPTKIPGMSYPSKQHTVATSLLGSSLPSRTGQSETESFDSVASSIPVSTPIHSQPAVPAITCADVPRSDISHVLKFEQSREALDHFLEENESAVSTNRLPRSSSPDEHPQATMMSTIRNIAGSMRGPSRRSSSGSQHNPLKPAEVNALPKSVIDEDIEPTGADTESDSKEELPETPTKQAGSNDYAWTSPFYPKSPTDDYDHTLYDEDKYLDTQFRYASKKRNDSFHHLFPNVPEDDRLLDDFSCALSREILLQGRVYVSEHYMCFNSNLLGWITNLVMSLDEIVRFERRTTAGLFPNGIIVVTKEAKHTFASFLSRDTTLNFIETIWSKSVALSLKRNEKARDLDVVQSGITINSNHSRLSESDILTIDEDASVHSGTTNESTSQYSVSDIQSDAETESGFQIEGPMTHSPTVHEDGKDEHEIMLIDFDVNAPMGYIYKLMFGVNSEFTEKVLGLSDGFEFTEFGPFEKTDESEAPLRTYQYQKGLNYAIGPKSTTVYATEYLVSRVLSDHVEVLTVVRTPDVPSGSAFDVRIRFLLTWGPNGYTHVACSYWVNWTGSSWIKGLIEKSTQSGQIKYGDDLKCEMLKSVPEDRDCYVTSSTEEEEIAIVEPVIPVKPKEIKPTPKSKSLKKIIPWPLVIGVVFVVLVEILLIMYLVGLNRNISGILKTQNVIMESIDKLQRQLAEQQLLLRRR